MIIINDFSPEKLKSFNQKYPNKKDINYASIVCEIEQHNMSTPFKLLNIIIKQDEPSDGIVEVSSQNWGNRIGHLNIDHLSQIGFHLYMKPKLKKRATSEFNRMNEVLNQYLMTIEGNK